MKKKVLLNCLLLILIYPSIVAPSEAAEKEVSFKAEDGWTLYGMFDMPQETTGKVPAVIFLHSYEHDQDTYGQYLYPGLAQIIGSRKVATLRFDFRGRGKSAGSKPLHMFSPDELEKLSLDVRAAIRFLASQPRVDATRIGVVAEGKSAEAAVMGWGGDERVVAMQLISGRLSEAAKKEIAANTKLALYLIVSEEDREGLRDMADAYRLSKNEESQISVYEEMGMGTTMFSVWRSAYPKEKPIEDGLADWLVERLGRKGEKREVTFKTEDGWTLYGTLRTPEFLNSDAPVPGVVLIHSSFTDRGIFDHLAEEMVKRGLVILNFDTRGRGKSDEKGKFISLPVEEREKGYLDAKAALEFLSSQAGVSRAGLLGTDRGAIYALQAATGDSRVGALVLMTTLLNEKFRSDIAKLEIPIFYLASEDIEIATKAMADAYASTKHRGSRLVVYKGGALGYEIFHMDENLEPALAQWMKEQLSR